MFDKSLYEKYDMLGKETLLKILQTKGYELIGDINQEYYKSTDLITRDPQNNEVKWEIEVKNDKQFNNVVTGKYQSMIVNYRKAKNNSHWFVSFNRSLDKFLLCSLDKIKSSPTKKIHTNRGVETVFDVPRKALALYSFDKNTYATTKENL